MIKKLIFLLFFLVVSCISEEAPLTTNSNSFALMQPGDPVVTNYLGDSAFLLDSDGNFKKMLYNVINNQEQVVGADWHPVLNEVIITINGFPDRVMAINPVNGEVRELLRHNQLSGEYFWSRCFR